ncbi:MAG TPA: hypothetical protein VNG53_00710 [Bacteroidia bacterium]|nr:hypothetical protein [Bacteroidia bacterium]
MIEDLTKEKLIEYGFDEENIERLFTWENYGCNLMNDRGYFFASNIEKKIYSGIEGKEKQFSQSLLPQHHKEPKEQFETFQELFKYAVLVGSIERPSNSFLYSNKESQYNWGFNVWLQNYKNWNYGDGAAYKLLLTRTTWIEYLAHCEKEQKELEQRAKELKEKWQPEKTALPITKNSPLGASGSTHFHLVNIPKKLRVIFDKTERLLPIFFKIEAILTTDTTNSFMFSELIEHTKEFLLNEVV